MEIDEEDDSCGNDQGRGFENISFVGLFELFYLYLYSVSMP